MTSSIPALDIRRRLGRTDWEPPREFGPDGWVFDKMLERERTRIIVSVAPSDGVDWVHASVSHPDTMPTYEELVALHAAVWPGGFAYQAFVPPSRHVNIHPYALHLWGRRDGKNVLPDFGILGTI